ncbi:putative malate dehydrogenase 1B [Orussus abietinus]|uniref:putative malate dehydrogenase 1B n=1 Tax=Orussus abietinus TaxID=222816 RepID=UPI000C715E07|nr:putative malate dehydrogenase 1B [Orussus abietinus]
MAADKVITVVAGIPNDMAFGHVCYVASNLSDMLPNFYFERIFKKEDEWKPWLEEICNANNWSHMTSPLIWRENGICGGNRSYVGGVTQFWELIHEYYGIVSRLTRSQLEKLKLDTTLSQNIQKQYRRVTIIGAGKSFCQDLVAQLVTMKELQLQLGVTVNLIDTATNFSKLREIVKDASLIGGGLNAAIVLHSIPDGLSDCDILLILDYVPRQGQGKTEKWLRRNYESTHELAEQINRYAPSHMKVIFCSTGPTCFCAGVLTKFATKLRKENIVAVSAHYALEVVYNFLKSMNIPLNEVGCPPVWGFLGVNDFIDMCHMLQKHRVVKLDTKASIPSEKSTLPIGTNCTEFRWFFYAVHNKSPYEMQPIYENNFAIRTSQGNNNHMCKAICDIIKIWYSENDNSDDQIVSLGIFSDGTFGIPEGLFFSQPVYLQKTKERFRKWTPCSEFPTPNIPSWIFRSLISTADEIVRKFIQLN